MQISSSVSPKRSQDLLKIKGEAIDLNNNNNNSKLTPFKQDAKQYLDKVLNLMNILNEVDGMTNVADLKNKLEKLKLLLLKARAERDEYQIQASKLQ